MECLGDRNTFFNACYRNTFFNACYQNLVSILNETYVTKTSKKHLLFFTKTRHENLYFLCLKNYEATVP